MIKVVAAIIRNQNKILICRRAEEGDCADLWEFPGGKLEPGETMERCLIRECEEELGIRIKVIDLFAETKYQYPEHEIAFSFFNAEIREGTVSAIVHQELRWVTPDEMERYEFCPADIEIVKKLVGTKDGT
jgi:8-oxo-dGTP diphosphatase